jgi:hypothetical protein
VRTVLSSEVIIRTHGKERTNKTIGPARKNAHPTSDRGMRKQTIIESNPVEDNRVSQPNGLLGLAKKKSKPRKAPSLALTARSSWGAVVRGEAATAARVRPSPTKHKPLATPAQVRLNLAPRLDHARRRTAQPPGEVLRF